MSGLIRRRRAQKRARRRLAALTTTALGLTSLTLLASPTAQADLPDWVVIDNGTVQLGVHDLGHLNVPADIESAGGTLPVGLRLLSTNNEATAPGCLCEGWGLADATSTVSGYANEAAGESANLTVLSFTATASNAVSTVRIGDTFEVTHDYHPSPATPNLYEVTVTVKNVSAAPVEPRYRRVMDWDVEPTAFDEFSTIQGTAGAENVLFASDDGFASSDPLSGPSEIAFSGDAVDNGPDDHGALFDFGFPTLAAGQTFSFKTFYGGAATETAAENAIGAVGAEVYSFGQPSTPDGPTLGTPNTFIFAFAGVGGEPQVPQVSLGAPTATVNEGAGEIVLPVNLNTEATEPVTVEATTSDGSATAPGDYGAVDTTVTIPAGQSSGSVTVPIVDDTDDESDETFTVQLSDPTGAVLGDPASTTVTITDNDEPTGENQPPVASNQSVTTPQDTAKAITLQATDPDGDTLTYEIVDEPDHGTLTGTGADRTYTPDAGYTGPDSFTFRANDGQVDSNTATVDITVTTPTPTNDPPVASNQSVTTPQDTAKAITLQATDPDGDTLTYEIVDEPDHGTLTGTGADRTYTPDAGYTGPDSFTFRANDGQVDSNTATVDITVTPVAEKVWARGFGKVVDKKGHHFHLFKFAFRARIQSDGDLVGRAVERTPHGWFVGRELTSLTVVDDTATAVYSGEFRGRTGYTLTITAVDAPRDRVTLVISKGGKVVSSVSGRVLKGGVKVSG